MYNMLDILSFLDLWSVNHGIILSPEFLLCDVWCRFQLLVQEIQLLDGLKNKLINKININIRSKKNYSFAKIYGFIVSFFNSSYIFCYVDFFLFHLTFAYFCRFIQGR